MHIQMDKFAKLDCILLYNSAELLIIQNVMEIPLTTKRMTAVGNLELTKLVQLCGNIQTVPRIGKKGGD
jgi:hypothetical protein